ncbi:MAG: TolC family protein [Elusimicrobiota bacterium]|nr:TolC family protein [Elusimicrobiota bacterium]
MKLILIFLMLPCTARAAEFTATLKAAEQGALAASGQYKSAKFSAQAAAAAEAAAGTLLYPRLSLEGSLRYIHTISEIPMPAAAGGARPLGDNWNYSIGPSAYWTLDGGTLRAGREAARHTASGRSSEAENVRRQTLLKARVSYFQLQLALEKVYLIAENLQVALSQFKDMELGVKAGSRSRLDGIRARQETTARRRDLLRARAELSSVLREFSFVTGLEPPAGTGMPLDARMAGKDYGGETFAGLLVRAEPYEEILSRLLPAAEKGLGSELPAVTAMSEAAAAWRASASAQKAEKLPRLTLSARSSIDYPNGPDLYSFVQNSAGLSLQLPLFESGRLEERQKESRLNAEAAAERGGDAARAAGRDFAAALDAYGALMDEQALNIDALDDAGEAAKLAYAAYKAGGGTWLEVESANLKELQAKTTAASANAEILMKLALLDSLSED